MRYNEIIESQDDDDDLFGRGLHHRIADALLAQGEEDQRVSDEERGNGDLENAAEFAEQARNYRYIADAFNQSMAMGVKVYRSLDRSWKGAVDDVVDIELDMDFRDYVKQIPESADDSNTNNVIAQKIFFARSNKTPKGWSYDHVGFITQSGKQIQMSGHKGNDVYVTNAVTDDPEFSKQNITVMPLSKPVTVPTTNSVGAENCGTFVANVLKANGVKDFDLQKIYSTFKTPPQSDMVESADDDDLFSTSPKLDRRQELKAKAIRRIEKRDALNIQPGTRLMVKWDNGKYYKGKVVRLTPSGRVIAQVKFHNVGWPLEKNISPRDIKPEHILKETDDDMFAKNSQMSQDIKTKLKQIDDPYLRTVRKIRELAKTKYGAKIRVSSAPKTSARGRATVWVGDYDANYQIPKTTPEAFRVKEDLEQMGFECRFTDAGWLSVKVPPVFSNLISEESDDELFGQEDGARQALKLLKLLRAAVARDPRGVANMLKQRKDEYSNAEQPVDDTLDYMAQAVGMPREIFDKYADDFFILPWPRDVSMNRPWQIWDTQVLDQIIETMTRVVYGESVNKDTDDELFGSDSSGMKGIIYRTGRQMLSRLSQSWNDPNVRFEYKEYQEADDSDAMFDQVVRLTRVKFKQAFVIDTILREYAGMAGLNDFGWMLESGEFQDLVDAWERFREDADIEQEDWFQREVQDFKGER